MTQQANIFRVCFMPLFSGAPDEEHTEFGNQLRAVGSSILDGHYPHIVTIDATQEAADHIAGLPFVAYVEPVSDTTQR
ncbi:hypothetical protein [Nocardia noduli]|uniref:hypothetical protein n=1 Tax=Nocardia noduli TaxID=2815722 RepID=UPI001C24CAB2|nr:hypothetical protein [Nocardia noduli]